MSILRRIVIIVLVLAVISGKAGIAFAQESTVSITGQVVNGTEGGGGVEGTIVTLLVYSEDALEDTLTTMADREGRFSFDGIPPGYTYLVSPRYMEVDYYYQVEFEDGNPDAFIEAPVCDTTSSDDMIVAGLCHIIINVNEESLEVTQVIYFYNDGDRTYTDGDGSLLLTLPDQAYSFSAPQDLIQDYQFFEDNTMHYLVPFPPGELQLVFAYEIAPDDSTEYNFLLPIDYPTESMELLISGEGIETAVSGLVPADPVITEENERYIHFQGTDITRGAEIGITISRVSESILPYVVARCGIIAVMAAGIIIYLRKRRS
jgi:hypothetical protein